MAEIWPDEGLDLVLAVFPKGGSNPATTYLSLFTTFTASTVGTAAQTEDAYTEPSGGAFALQSLAAATWGAAAATTTPITGRKTTYSQVTFPTATAAWGTINGFHVKNTSTVGGGAVYFAANFDDTTAVTINTNDVIKVTPTIVYGN